MLRGSKGSIQESHPRQFGYGRAPITRLDFEPDSVRERDDAFGSASVPLHRHGLSAHHDRVSNLVQRAAEIQKAGLDAVKATLGRPHPNRI